MRSLCRHQRERRRIERHNQRAGKSASNHGQASSGFCQGHQRSRGNTSFVEIGPGSGAVATADGYSERHFGGKTFDAFDPPAHHAAAAALHDRLVSIGFGPDRAAALFGVKEIADVRASRAGYFDAFVLPHDAAGRAARFFVLHQPESEADLRTWLGDAAVDLLIEMAAIITVAGRRRSLVSATWFAGRLIFADARAYNAVWPDEPFADYVMPPGGDSVGLERVAPRTPRRATLDICCGAGAQTLAAAAYSETVVGVDLNPRALRFARFNAAVNRVDHATFVLGDVYEPLGDARFDAILANPPFVPWPPDDAELLYRGGGPTGDDVLARILAGAVARLEAHGSLAIVADFANVASLAERIARWQGESRRTLIVLQHNYELLAYAETHAAHHDDPARRQAQVVRLLQHFKSAEIQTLDFGYIVQEAASGSTHVVRTAAPLAASISADVAAWFAHQRRLATDDISDTVLELAPGLGLVDVAERAPDGKTGASCYVAPGPASLHEPGAVSRPAFALLIRVAAGNVRPRDVTDEAAARELRELLQRGLVRLQATS
jgi:carbamoyltransferase